jgi:DNA modification methylase
MRTAPEPDQRWRLVRAEAIDVLTSEAPHSVDAVVTDPPYGIGFGGERWDNLGRPDGSSSGEAFEAWTRAWAAACLRTLKPGGFLVAFGAPRTVHRLAAGIEDAGFELRDQLVWLYGSGIPKSPLVEGRSSTLKPAYEPIVLARAPLIGNHKLNEKSWGTGRLGIDDARIPAPDAPHGRWPCNIALSHAPSCRTTRCAPACAVSLVDRARPKSRPSRFFYCAKPSFAEREAGCEPLAARRMRIYGRGGSRPRRNTHPTVKPVELMRWLLRLACPPGGVVLDPFAGSGSTGVAALAEGRRFLGVEQDAGYVRVACARLRHAATSGASAKGAGGWPSGDRNREGFWSPSSHPRPRKRRNEP